MSFGPPVKVIQAGTQVSSGQHFLGVALGHDVVIGNAVRLNYGVEVPGGAVLVAPSAGLVRDAGSAVPGEPVRWQPGGHVAPVKRRTLLRRRRPARDRIGTPTGG